MGCDDIASPMQCIKNIITNITIKQETADFMKSLKLGSVAIFFIFIPCILRELTSGFISKRAKYFIDYFIKW